MPPPGSTKRRRGRATEAAAAEADALISLPPEVLDDILTRLGIRDVVRTSALSRSWRRRWEALPSLDLHFPRPGDDEGEGASDGLGVVDGILLRYPGCVRLFYAGLDGPYAGRIHDWLCVLSRRGVEILDLSFTGSFPSLPSSVFSCGRLTELILCGCSIPLLPPGFVAFPELETLALNNARLQENGEYQLEEIIDTSPLLEYLSLYNVLSAGANTGKWVIRAPNLRDLMICSGNNDGWILEKLTSLCSAKICFAGSHFHHFLVHSDFPKLLSGLVQVTELVVGMSNIPILDKEQQEFEANGEFLNALWTDGMCANLQVVQMIRTTWCPNEMSFMELILSKAMLLNTLLISPGEKTVMSTEDALNELLTYKRASAEAVDLFKGKAEAF